MPSSSHLPSSSSSFRSQHDSISQGRVSSSIDKKRTSNDAVYVSSRSADALLSDHRATTLHPQCLNFVNDLLDELLSNIIKRSLGLSTDKLKTNAISIIIPPPLGRDAVGEAELELLSWLDSEEGRLWRGIKETRYVASNTEDGQVWPWKSAWELMRVMTQSYSTLGDRPSSEALERSFVVTLKAQGGDVRPGIIDPAALYLTAIVEHVAEHILSSLSRVMGHEQGLSQAGPKELHSALCEDEALYGMVKGMKIKSTIERAITSPRKVSNPPSSVSSHKSRASTSNPPSSSTTRPSTVYTSTSASHPSDFGPMYSSNPPSGYRSSLDSYSSAGPISPPTSSSKQSFSLGRKSTSSQRNGGTGVLEGRSSIHTYDSTDRVLVEGGEGGPMNDEDKEFDDFLRGGSTMKLSLTPQSLKTSDGYENQPTPRRQNSIARRPPPPVDPAPSSQSPGRTMSASNRGGIQPSSSLRESISKPSFGGGGRLAAREPTARLDEAEEEEDEEDIMMRGGKRAPRKESLVELLSSDPPWSDKSASPSPRVRQQSVPRSVPASPALNSRRSSPDQNPTPPTSSFRGTDNRSVSSNSASGFATPPIRASPSMPASSKFDSLSGQASGPMSRDRPVPRSPKDYEESDSDDELLGRKKKPGPLRSQDLIAFLDGPPPSSMNNSSVPSSPSQQTLDNANGPKPKKSGMFKGLVSKLTGAGSSSPSKDGLPSPPPSSYNSSSLRSSKGSHGQQSSVSKPPQGVRRSKSSSSFSEVKTNTPFVANNSEPLPPAKESAFAPIPPRARSKSSTSREQAFATAQEPPPLPTTVTDFTNHISRSSSSSHNGFAPPPPPAKTQPPQTNFIAAPPPTSPQQQDDSFVASPPRRSTSSSSPPVDNGLPSRPPRGARPSNGNRELPTPVAAPPPVGLFVEEPASHSMDVSPAPSEAPSFGFPSRLRTMTTPEGFQKIDETRAKRFSPLGLPVEESVERSVKEDETSGLPTPVASPPSAASADEDHYDPTPFSVAIAEEPEAEAAEATTSSPVVKPTPSAAALTAPPPTATEPTPLPPSVPHSSLLQLRALVAHATTADECRLLVNSLLSQWNVPFPALPESEAGDASEERAREREEQVGRVHGWLLEESSRERPEEEVVAPATDAKEDEAVVAEEVEAKEEAATELKAQQEEQQHQGKVVGALLDGEIQTEDEEYADAAEGDDSFSHLSSSHGHGKEEVVA